MFSLNIQALELATQEKEFVATSSKIKVALMPDFHPFSYIEEDRIVGFENDLLQIISQKTGLTFEKKYDIWNRNLKAFKQKNVDIITTISHNKEREPFTLFTTPYYNIPIVIFVRDDFGKYDGIHRLDGKKIGILKDIFYANMLKNNLDGEFYTYETYEDLTQALVFGKIDALVQNLSNINHLIKKNLYTNLVLADELKLPGIKREDLRFGVNPDKPILHSIIQKALNDISKETWANLSDKWLSVKPIDSSHKEEDGFLIPLTKKEKTYLKNTTVRVGFINDYYPFSYLENDKIRGFSYEYFNLLASQVDMKFEVNVDNWAPTLDKFKKHEIDIIDAISYTKEREEFTNFSEPYFHIPNVIFARKDSFENYQGLESLRGKRVGITKNIYYFDSIKELGLFDLVVFESSREKIGALAIGKIDAAFNNLTSGQKYILQGGYTNIQILEELADSVVKKEDLRLGVSKDNLLLHSIIQKAANAITANDKIKLINKYFGVNPHDENRDINTKLSLNERIYLETKKEIRMCAIPDILPLEQIDENNRHRGIAEDVIQLVSQKIGKPIVLLPTKSWSESLDSIRDKKCDILPAAVSTENRKQYLDFTEPYLVETLVVATRDDQFFIADSNDLKERKIGIVESYVFVELLKKKNPDIEIIQVKSAKEGLKKVQTGELFGYVDILPSIAYVIQREGLFDLKVAGKLEFDAEFSVASRNDEPYLNSIIQKALNDIGEEEIRGIMGKWFSITIEQAFDYRRLVYISIFFLTILSVVLYKNRSIRALNKKLEELSITDNLTKLYNRNKLEEALDAEANRSNRFEHTFSVIMVDIDYFKNVNDVHGHQMGDVVLKEFAQILKSNSRKTDIVGRWGGEEFMIVCSETNLAGAISLAKSMKEKISAYPFSLGEQKTASFGVSEYRKDEDIKNLLKRADDALYNAKNSGRDKIEIL